MRRDDDDQLRLLLLVVRGAEQGAEHRDRTKIRQLRDTVGAVRLQEAGDAEALAVPKLNSGAGLARHQARYREAADRNRIRGVELAYRWRQPEIDQAIREHRRHERQLDAKVLPFHRNRRAGARGRLHHRYWNLAASQKTRRVAGKRYEIGLREFTDQPLVLERGQQRVDLHVAVIDETRQHGTERRRAGAGKYSRKRRQRRSGGRDACWSQTGGAKSSPRYRSAPIHAQGPLRGTADL